MTVIKPIRLAGSAVALLSVLANTAVVGQEATPVYYTDKPFQQPALNDRASSPATDSRGQPLTLTASGDDRSSSLLTTSNDAGFQPAGVCGVVNDLLAGYCADRPDDLSCHFQ